MTGAHFGSVVAIAPRQTRLAAIPNTVAVAHP
jgi:hypothetical protein